MSAPTSTRVTARLLPESDGHGGARRSPRLAQRLSRHLTTALMGILLVMLAFTGLGGSSQPAQAAFGIPSMEDAAKMICNWTTDPPAASSSVNDRLMGHDSVRGIERTASEEFGIGGMFYSTYDLELSGCMGGLVPGFLANVSMLGATTVTNITTSMYTWATSDDLLESFTEPLNCVVEGCNGQVGLKDALFLQYLTTMVVLGALWGAYNGLFKKRTMHTAQGVVWMLCAAIFGIFFLSNPGLIAERSNQTIATFTDTVTNGVTGMSSSSITKDDPCWLPKKADDRGNRMASCAMWKAMSYQPWVIGQFGSTLTGKMPGAEATIGDRKVDDLRLAQLDAQSLSTGEEESYNTGLWTEVQESLESDPPASVSMKVWKGNDNNHRLGASVVALIASLCLGLLVMLISFSMVVMAVGMILLIMMAPIFLLVGIHPGFGRGIALKWLELLLGTMFKRIVLSAMLAILIAMYQVILSTSMGWFQQIALVLAVGIGAIVFRKPMLDTLNVVQLGGSSTGMEAGLQQQAKQASSGTVGAIAGGIAGGKIGGLDAMAKGAIKGGISGSRSGSMLRAASVGAGAGRRVGNRDKTADDKADRADQAKTTKGATPSTKSGPKDTAKRQKSEHTEAQAQDAEWRNQQASLDEILAGAVGEGTQPVGESTRRVESATDDRQEGVDDVMDALYAREQQEAWEMMAPSLPERRGVRIGEHVFYGESPTPQQAGSVPRPVTATPMPTAPATPAGVPPVTLPSAPGMPVAGAADMASAPPQRTLPTAPPVPNVSTREPNVSTREPNVSTREPNVSTGPTPVPHPTVPGSQPSTPGSQTGQGGRSSAPPRPQS